MTITTAENENNVRAREAALSRVSSALNLAAPTVSYQAGDRVLLLGPEHRIRLAVDRIKGRVRAFALVTEPMPEQLDGAMEAAAELMEQQPDLQLLRFELKSIEGYLGRFRVAVDINGRHCNLAELISDGEFFDTVLDLGCESRVAAELKPVGYRHVASGMPALEEAVDEFCELHGQFEKPRYVQVNSDLCAHSRHGLDGCNRCLDVCPADAIDVINGSVHLDVHLCHGAGGCASACPTAAIRYGYPQPQLLLERLGRLLQGYRDAGGQSPRVLIHDAEAGAAWVERQRASMPGHWLPLEIEELGAAGLDCWLSALAWGAAEVVLLDHEAVPDSIRLTLQQEIKTGNQMLVGLGLGTRLSLQAMGGLAQQPPSLLPVDWPASGMGADGGKRQQISAAMSHLYRHGDPAERLDEVALGSQAPFGTLEVAAEDCTLCMSCVGSCPSKALISGGDSPSLSLLEDQCVQCGLCEQACPEDAISLHPRYLLDPQRRTEPQVLKEEQPFCCTRCDKPFATHGMINTLLERLAGHSMFAGPALERLKMCEDCRVIDMVVNDPESELYHHARGQEPLPGHINPVVREGGQGPVDGGHNGAAVQIEGGDS